MDLLHANVKDAYFKYWSAAFGSALTTSVYSIVDVAMVGQYHGPLGTAAMAVIAPVWNILYSLGLLTGIGGSVLFSKICGENQHSTENEYFTVSLILTMLFSIVSWISFFFFSHPLLSLFGATNDTMALSLEYLHYIKFVIPVYLFNQMLAAFLRNDNAPLQATAGILAGGIFNIFGDYFFVFTLNMGIKGAGLATAAGGAISTLVLLSHFFTKKNTLHYKKPKRIVFKSIQIVQTGFSTFFIDIAMGILTTLFNRQIVTYLGTDALSVYGILIQISTFVQCCAYSIGQAAQPIISLNLGARFFRRILQVIKCAIRYAFVFGLAWFIAIMIFPSGFLYLFMEPTETVLSIAPSIIRCYGVSFILLPLNITSTFLFQSMLKPGISFIISVGRGLLLSGLLIFLLPILLPASSIWLVMPITEICISLFVAISIKQLIYHLQSGDS